MLEVTGFYRINADEYTVFVGNETKRDVIALRCRERHGQPPEPRLNWFSGGGSAIDTSDFVVTLGKAHDALSQIEGGVDPQLALAEARLYQE